MTKQQFRDLIEQSLLALVYAHQGISSCQIKEYLKKIQGDAYRDHQWTNRIMKLAGRVPGKDFIVRGKKVGKGYKYSFNSVKYRIERGWEEEIRKTDYSV